MAQKERVELRNRADQMAYQIDKRLKDMGDKMPVETKADLENKVQAVRDAIKAEDDSRIRSSHGSAGAGRDGRWARPSTVSPARARQGDMGMGGMGGTGGAPTGGTRAGGDDEDIVEGEFREA